MAWISPTTRSTGELITASIWNGDIVDNLNALKAPPTASVGHMSANASTTSTTFVDVDAIELSLDVTTTGGDIVVSFAGLGNVDNSTSTIYVDVTLDGTSVSGEVEGVWSARPSDTDERVPIVFTVLLESVAAGAHTIRLQFRTGVGTFTVYAECQFWAREVS